VSNLRTFRDWCAAMADDTTQPDDERALWQQLADEIDTYLTPPTEEPML
jgi:hypothetical protein